MLRDLLPCRRRVYSGLMQGRDPQIIPMQISRLGFLEGMFSIMEDEDFNSLFGRVGDSRGPKAELCKTHCLIRGRVIEERRE